MQITCERCGHEFEHEPRLRTAYGVGQPREADKAHAVCPECGTKLYQVGDDPTWRAER